MQKILKVIFFILSLMLPSQALANTLTLTSTATNNGNNNFTVADCQALTFTSNFTISVVGFRQDYFTLYLNGSSNLGAQKNNAGGFGNQVIIKTFTVPNAEGVYTVRRTGLGSLTSNTVTVTRAPGVTCTSPSTATSFGGNMWFATNNSISTPVVGDFDNDGYEDDIVYYGKCGTGHDSWRVHKSDGAAFETTCFSGASMWFQLSGVLSTPMVGDFDSDGFNDDLAYFGKCGNAGLKCWRAHIGNGTTFTATNLGADMWFAESDSRSKPFVGDFDNDGFKDDISYYGNCGNTPDKCWRTHLID